MTGRHFGSIYKGTYRRCRKCKGTGRLDRWGAEVIFGGTSNIGVYPRPARRLRHCARALTNAAIFFLPRADRERYAEEYRSELWELAQCGAGCLRQMMHALRTFLCSIPMGLALRSLSPQRKSAKL